MKIEIEYGRTGLAAGASAEASRKSEPEELLILAPIGRRIFLNTRVQPVHTKLSYLSYLIHYFAHHTIHKICRICSVFHSGGSELENSNRYFTTMNGSGGISPRSIRRRFVMARQAAQSPENGKRLFGYIRLCSLMFA